MTSKQNQMILPASDSILVQRQRAEEETLGLLQEYRQTRRTEIRERIVLLYVNLVEGIVRRFAANAREGSDDLRQEGYIGLLTAIDLYDPTKNTRFSTYATHFIIGQIRHYLRDRSKLIKEPAWVQELSRRVYQTSETLWQQQGRPPGNQEIAEAMGLPEETVSQVLSLRQNLNITSLDGGSSAEEEINAVDIERQGSVETAVNFHLALEDRLVLEAAMQTLKPVEKQALVAFYYQERSQTEIARQMGVSCNYVSYLLRSATQKMKRVLASEEMREQQWRWGQGRAEEGVTREAEPESMVDPLTRLYNQRYFMTRLEEEVFRAGRSEKPVAALFVQIGGLEPFQQAMGIRATEEVIRGIAETIRVSVRRTDILTRYGADTFALILPQTGANVETIRQRLRGILDDWLASRTLHQGKTPLVLGMGVAVYPTDAMQALPLATLAQAALTPYFAAVGVRR